MSNDATTEYQPSNVVSMSRDIGSQIYQSYANATSDGTWEKRDDSSLYFKDSDVEITATGDMFGGYKPLKGFIESHGFSGTRGGDEPHLEAHHLITGADCARAGLDVDRAPCVAVDAKGHANDLHGTSGLTNGVAYKDVEHMKDVYHSEYVGQGAPEWAERSTQFIEQNRNSFESGISKAAESAGESKSDLPRPFQNVEAVSEKPPEASTDSKGLHESFESNEKVA
jgi:hypothetical protein